MSKSEQFYQEYLSRRHVSRRGLFRAFANAARQLAPETASRLPTHPLPPGALPMSHFMVQCTQCYHCIDACPMGVLARHDSGLPQLSIAYACCDGCGQCIQACETGALQPQTCFDTGLRPTFSSACVNPVRTCKQCVDACPTQACSITDNGLPGISADACNGCGECLVQCQYDAVTLNALLS